jgi:UDP-glucose 4-epimerase
MNKNIIVVTGGAGFVGSNLIEILLKKTNFNLISIDNYSSGFEKNHINNKRIKYIKCHTKDIYKKLKKIKNKIHSLFHFGEFARIYQSFLDYNQCIESNFIGSQEVIRFCLENNIKLIYSATSASLGNLGKDKDLSPYAFTKSRNLELLNNLKKWFNFKFEIIYFYNVYGPKQIKTGKMATVIGIFEDCFEKKIPLPVVKPGKQSRRFTHIKDTIDICFFAWKKNMCRHYAISNKQSYSILQIAKMFGKKIKFLPPRKGERFASKLTKMNLSNKIYRFYGKQSIKNYIKSITQP